MLFNGLFTSSSLLWLLGAVLYITVSYFNVYATTSSYIFGSSRLFVFIYFPICLQYISVLYKIVPLDHVFKLNWILFTTVCFYVLFAIILILFTSMFFFALLIMYDHSFWTGRKIYPKFMIKKAILISCLKLMNISWVAGYIFSREK